MFITGFQVSYTTIHVGAVMNIGDLARAPAVFGSNTVAGGGGSGDVVVLVVYSSTIGRNIRVHLLQRI